MPRGTEQPLSKSRLMAYRQCARRLWLELHRRDLHDTAAAGTRPRFGDEVGRVARTLFDRSGRGVLIDRGDRLDSAINRSVAALASPRPVFEAGFHAARAVAFADILLPVRRAGRFLWRMIEVKSAGSVKPHHEDEAALQAYVARRAGLPLDSIAIAHIDTSWVYGGAGDYAGLLVESDITATALRREAEVACWIDDAHSVAGARRPPVARTGAQCSDPYPCPYLAHCGADEPSAAHPVAWLPQLRAKAAKDLIAAQGIIDMRDVPNDLLSERQQRVKTSTLSGKAYFDRAGAAAALKPHPLPAHFLDFETIAFPVPRWQGLRPYQQTAFQFSVHRLARDGGLHHIPFLDLSGEDPSRKLAKALVVACGKGGPVFAYNASFERRCILDLADRVRSHAVRLRALAERLVDLRPIAEAHFYHPSMEGSWSLKKLLPAVVPRLDHGALNGVQNGDMAIDAYLEAIEEGTTVERKAELERQLLDYCALDTLALVGIWRVFSGTKIGVSMPGSRAGNASGGVMTQRTRP